MPTGANYLKNHLEDRVKETGEAIEKYSRAAKRDKDFILEFSQSDPKTAEIYQNWLIFDKEKVTYFNEVMKDLLARLERMK